ncbi:MAG TPA: HGxxPAAW family protein [Mycobacteriales bacterium]|nr:HGxxPAAW family protein [Mycobacteriales bacterium]
MAGESTGGHGATPVVWVATAMMMVGVVVGGIALIEWIWPIFWIGVGITVAGGVVGYFGRIMDMVTEYAPPTPETTEPG